MAGIQAFRPVKLVCGIIAAEGPYAGAAEERLAEMFGPIDGRGPRIAFAGTAYYQPEMGTGLRRGFVSFRDLIRPEALPSIKLRTNALEENLRNDFAGPRRIVNLDPGYLTSAALIMATAKDFSHRVPLADGIYAHLELLFGKSGARRFPWTYPDFRAEDHIPFFMGARRSYLETLRSLERDRQS